MSNAPLAVSIRIPITKRQILGIMEKDDFIPSIAPLKNASCPFFVFKRIKEKTVMITGKAREET